MKIRLFAKGDLLPILKLFNKNSDHDRLTNDLLSEKLFDDPDFDPHITLVTEINGKMIGFVQGVLRCIRGENIGYIKLMVVDKKYRRQGIARSMYKIIENHFKEHGASKVKIYDVPFNYFMPGIDPLYTPALCFAWRMGFERIGDTSNLLVELQNQDWSTWAEEAKLEKENITIKRITESDRDELFTFIAEHFELWKTEVEMSFSSNPIAVHIARLNGKLKAFSGHNGNNIGMGWFGPMGTHPDLRGKGIGGVLLKRCLQDMKNWKLKYSIIPWVGPIDFYSHYANALVDRVFWRFDKKLR